MEQGKEMQGRERKEFQGRAEREVSLRPPVDIYEESRGITLKADLPGVSRERLNIEVDGTTLSIEGEAAIDVPKDMEAVYADVRTTRFRRSFTLSTELDSDKIDAQMKDGVLTLTVPKRAEHQPRKIEVHAG